VQRLIVCLPLCYVLAQGFRYIWMCLSLGGVAVSLEQGSQTAWKRVVVWCVVEVMACAALHGVKLVVSNDPTVVQLVLAGLGRWLIWARAKWVDIACG